MSVVLDASALLAFFLGEPGSDAVRAVLDDALINTVNLSEIYATAVEKGVDVEAVRNSVTALSIRIVPFGETHAFIAGELRKHTRRHGLSLGDRACLATAIIEKCPVITADRIWLKVGLDMEITLIR